MRPAFKLLDQPTITQIIDEARQLLQNPGVRVHNREALDLLANAGAKVDFDEQVAFIIKRLLMAAIPASSIRGQPRYPFWIAKLAGSANH